MLAFDPLIFHEVHVDLRHPHAAAVGTRPLFDVKTKSSRFISMGDTFRKLAEEIADLIEELDVGSRIRAGCSADGGLVDGDHLIDYFDIVDPLVLADGELRVVELVG